MRPQRQRRCGKASRPGIAVHSCGSLGPWILGGAWRRKPNMDRSAFFSMSLFPLVQLPENRHRLRVIFLGPFGPAVAADGLELPMALLRIPGSGFLDPVVARLPAAAHWTTSFIRSSNFFPVTLFTT